MRLLVVLITALLGIGALSPSSQAADPAVVFANANKAGGIAYTEGWFGKGDTRLHYVEAGEGPLIIFYHGFPSTWFSWFDQMEALKTHYRVIAVDGLGAGLSAKPDRLEPYKVKNLAAQLDRLARHLNGRKRFVLVGHDWGAALAFAYAQGYPDRLDAVIALSAPPYNLFLDIARNDPEQQARSAYMQRFGALTLNDIRTGNLGAAIARGAYADLLASGSIAAEEHALFVSALSPPETINGGMNWYRANIAAFADIDAADRWPRHARRIKVPALLLWGEADKAFVPGFLDRMGEYAECVEIRRFAGAGHWLTMERPEAVNAAIADHIQANAGSKVRPSESRLRPRPLHCHQPQTAAR
jgi:pimeloyl-ACP methyl ester carboxylesterase